MKSQDRSGPPMMWGSTVRRKGAEFSVSRWLTHKETRKAHECTDPCIGFLVSKMHPSLKYMIKLILVKNIHFFFYFISASLEFSKFSGLQKLSTTKKSYVLKRFRNYSLVFNLQGKPIWRIKTKFCHHHVYL